MFRASFSRDLVFALPAYSGGCERDFLFHLFIQRATSSVLSGGRWEGSGFRYSSHGQSKPVLLKAGGIRLYRKALPFFLGLILGEFIVGGTWVIIRLLWDIEVYSFYR